MSRARTHRTQPTAAALQRNSYYRPRRGRTQGEERTSSKQGPQHFWKSCSRPTNPAPTSAAGVLWKPTGLPTATEIPFLLGHNSTCSYDLRAAPATPTTFILHSHLRSDMQNRWVQLEHPLGSSSPDTAFTARLMITQPRRSTDNPKQAKVPLLLRVGTAKAPQSSCQNAAQVTTSKRDAAPLTESTPFLTVSSSPCLTCHSPPPYFMAGRKRKKRKK